MMEEYLKEDLILSAFEESELIKNFVFRDTVESTNTLARELAEMGEPEITVVWAEAQTQGRGRQGRKWFSEPHQNILMSLILRPKIPPERVFLNIMALSLAGILAIESIAQLKPRLKWPNDILLNGKKIGGILTEYSLKKNQIDYVISGIGLNVNWSPPEPDLVYPASSLFSETKKRFSREKLAIKILKNFEILYELIRAKRFQDLRQKWEKKLDLFGKRVTVSTDGRELTGMPLAIRDDGSLLLKTDTGQELIIRSGDIVLSSAQ